MDIKAKGTPEGAPNTYAHTSNLTTSTTASQRIYESERRARKEFIEDKLFEVLKVRNDFEDIKYGRNIHTEHEYVRVRDIFGGHITIDISGLELSKILEFVCWIVLNGVVKDGKLPIPDGIVTDKQELRRLVPLFK